MKYFVSYQPYEKAHIVLEGSEFVKEFLESLLDKDFWTETTWLEYWLYRIFE